MTITREVEIRKETSREALFRRLIDWSKTSYAEAFRNAQFPDARAADLLRYVLSYQKLEDKPMDGFSSQGLRKTEKEISGICYVDFYNEISSRDDWTPVDLLYLLCKTVIDNEETYSAIAAEKGVSLYVLGAEMCGRLLRALPSYIREDQLFDSLERAFPDGRWNRDANLDKKAHCDMKLTLNGKDYHIWSFLNSPRSVANFTSKFNESRGHVPNGYHLLCPFNYGTSQCVIFKGWSLYSREHSDRVLSAVYQAAPLEYSKTVKSRDFFSRSFYNNPKLIQKSL